MNNFDKEKYRDMVFHGYKWFAHEKGIHSFSKKDVRGYHVVECSEEQLYNGDIEFMTLHGITLSKERKQEIQKNFSTV